MPDIDFDLVADALLREGARRQKLATKASADPDTDPAQVVRVLRDASLLLEYAELFRVTPSEGRAAILADVSPHDRTVVSIPQPASAEQSSVAAGATNDIVELQQPARVRNLLQEMAAEARKAAVGDGDRHDADEINVPKQAYVLSAGAIDALLGDDTDPLPEDERSPSASNSVAHQDAFTDGPLAQ